MKKLLIPLLIVLLTGCSISEKRLDSPSPSSCDQPTSTVDREILEPYAIAAFDSCGKINEYKTQPWSEKLNTKIRDNHIYLSSDAELCYSEEENTVLFVEQCHSGRKFKIFKYNIENSTLSEAKIWTDNHECAFPYFEFGKQERHIIPVFNEKSLGDYCDRTIRYDYDYVNNNAMLAEVCTICTQYGNTIRTDCIKYSRDYWNKKSIPVPAPLKDCGIPEDFKENKWFDDLTEKIENFPPYENLPKRPWLNEKISMDSMSEICHVKDHNLVIALQRGAPYFRGAVYRYNIKTKTFTKAPFPIDDGLEFSEFVSQIGNSLIVTSEFGDAGNATFEEHSYDYLCDNFKLIKSCQYVGDGNSNCTEYK